MLLKYPMHFEYIPMINERWLSLFSLYKLLTSAFCLFECCFYSVVLIINIFEVKNLVFLICEDVLKLTIFKTKILKLYKTVLKKSYCCVLKKSIF